MRPNQVLERVPGNRRLCLVGSPAKAATREHRPTMRQDHRMSLSLTAQILGVWSLRLKLGHRQIHQLYMPTERENAVKARKREPRRTEEGRLKKERRERGLPAFPRGGLCILYIVCGERSVPWNRKRQRNTPAFAFPKSSKVYSKSLIQPRY